MDRLPTRRSDLMSRGLGAETVVVDGATNAAHALSPVAASVFALCDGKATVASAASTLSLAVADVELAVVTLTSLGLVTGAGMTRRTAIQRASLIGGGALVATVVAPLAAAHASGVSVVTGPTPTTIGNGTTPRANTDSATSITTLVTDAVVPAGKTLLTSFSAYTQSATGTLLFVVVSGGTISYVSPTPIPAVAGDITTSGPVTVTVAEGDYIGFYSSSTGTVTFDATGAIDGTNAGGPVTQTADSSAAPQSGDAVSGYMYHGLSRVYSLSAVVQ